MKKKKNCNFVEINDSDLREIKGGTRKSAHTGSAKNVKRCLFSFFTKC